jgi:hypothetical protein
MRACEYPVGADGVSQHQMRISHLFQPQPGLIHPVGTDGVPARVMVLSFFAHVPPANPVSADGVQSELLRVLHLSQRELL